MASSKKGSEEETRDWTELSTTEIHAKALTAFLKFVEESEKMSLGNTQKCQLALLKYLWSFPKKAPLSEVAQLPGVQPLEHYLLMSNCHDAFTGDKVISTNEIYETYLDWIIKLRQKIRSEEPTRERRLLGFS